MSTQNEREAALRRALHAAADGIEPRADGLQRIQARLRPPRPLALAWADAIWTDVRFRVPSLLQEWLEQLLAAFSLVWQRFGPRPRHASERRSRARSWLRPVAALGVTVFVVAAGAYVAIDAQQAIFPSSSNSAHSNGGGGGAGPGSQGNPGGSAQSQAVSGPYSGHSGTAKTPSCRPTKPSGGGPAASGSAGTSQSASPSTSPTGSSSPSPTPTVSNSSSPNPSGTATGATALGPGAGSTSPGVAALANPAILARSSVLNVTPSPCARKKRPGSTSSPHPSAQPAVVSFGKLNHD